MDVAKPTKAISNGILSYMPCLKSLKVESSHELEAVGVLKALLELSV